MGYTVYCKNQSIWNPSLAVGNLFLNSLKSVEKMIGIKSGITSPSADSIEIEAEELSIFVNKLLDYIERTNNTALLTMISGITEIILALNGKINNEFPAITEKNRFLGVQSQSVMV
jgi:hypothetical protein